MSALEGKRKFGIYKSREEQIRRKYMSTNNGKKLAGKIAVITGGSSGIGLATAKLFVQEGAYVFITGRRQTELEKAKIEIGKNVTAVQGDVAKLSDLDNLYAAVKSEKGALDIVVANAAIVEQVVTKDVTPEHYDRTFNINARGSFFAVQKALPLLRNGGSIVLVSSVASVKGIPFYVTYSATKAAMRSFTRSWAADFKDRGIRVNTLSPGPIDTPIMDSQFKSKEQVDALKANFAQMVPLGRLGRSEEMASAILFLASDDSSFITGIDLQADGGLTQI
jgi:NAD(P)-dependent dehydrogenase (short-subunit alcohol dehydrogenase family)